MRSPTASTDRGTQSQRDPDPARPHFPGSWGRLQDRVPTLALLRRVLNASDSKSELIGHSRSPVRPYRFMDWATQGFLAIVAILLVVFHRRAPAPWPWIVVGHVLAMVVIHRLVMSVAGGTRNPAVRFLREIYPMILYTAFFRETELVNTAIGIPRLDPHFLRLEDHLFGAQPSVVLMSAIPSLWVSELLYASYFAYYVMVVGTGLWLMTRNRSAFRHFISVVSFVFYACYLFYMAVPVIGPRLLFRATPEQAWYAATYPLLPLPSIPESVQQGPFFHLMAFIYRHFEAMSAAFPSSHVAIAVTTLWFSWRYLRPIRWIHAVAVVLLCISTVYCHYHYAVDVPAGILAAAVLIPLANWGYRRVDPEGEPVALPHRR